MPTQGVLVRQRVGEAIVAAARTHAHSVGEHLQTHLAAAVRPGETHPDWIDLQLELARHLEASLEALAEADAEHLAELASASETRRRRDRATRGLYQTVRDLRGGFAGVFGLAQAARLLGVEGETARRPRPLLRQARQVVARLRDPLPELTESVPGIDAECGRVAARIQTAIERLEQALTEVELEAAQRRLTGAVRRGALEVFDRAVRGVGRMLKGCHALAGRPELARRVRFDVKTKGGA